jgi:C-terminal processing protease CtpA/Prc
MKCRAIWSTLALLAAVSLSAAVQPCFAQQQKFTDRQREDAREMLRMIAADVRKHYFDARLRGFDFDARVREVDEKLKSATSLNQSFALIGFALDGLNDSHTFFIPPGRTFRHEYGWRMRMIGDRCFITHVRPRTDAEAKGIKPGDEVLSVNGATPTRGNFETMQYVFNVLAPRGATQLVVRGAEGEQRQVVIEARVRQLQKLVDLTGGQADVLIWNFVRENENYDHLRRMICRESGPELAICKMPEFDLSGDEVHELLSFARRHKSLILDLRGNPGGYVSTLENVVSGFFDHEVKIADRVGRKDLKPQKAKPGHTLFNGKLVVLVDSMSASAAEIFARVVQLEKRGTVLGDHTLGLVMEAKGYEYMLGVESVAWYGASITDANIVMSDGKSLEGTGVVPDELVLPTAADLRDNRDPVIARAAELLGVKLEAEKAGKFFPYEWPKD